jgi:hypothetical protein
MLSIYLFKSGWAYELQRLYAMIEDRLLVKPLHLNPMALQKLRDTCQLDIPVTRDMQTVKLDELDYHHKIAEAFYTSLSLLISFGRMYTATLPEDKVFALAALLLPLFSSKSLRSSGSLIILSRFSRHIPTLTLQLFATPSSCGCCREVRRFFRERKNLPSWVPDYNVYIVNPLVYLEEPKFSAVKGWEASCSPSVLGWHLAVTGILFDCIEALGPCHDGVDGEPMATNPTPWLEFCLTMPQRYPNHQHRAEIFMHTPVCDQASTFLAIELASRFRAYLVYSAQVAWKWINFGNIERSSLYFMISKLRLNSWIPTLLEVLDLADSILNDSVENKDFFGTSEEFFKRPHLNAITGRRLFASKGYIGLAPMSAEAGDWIVFLPGSAALLCPRR